MLALHRYLRQKILGLGHQTYKLLVSGAIYLVLKNGIPFLFLEDENLVLRDTFQT